MENFNNFLDYRQLISARELLWASLEKFNSDQVQDAIERIDDFLGDRAAFVSAWIVSIFTANIPVVMASLSDEEREPYENGDILGNYVAAIEKCIEDLLEYITQDNIVIWGEDPLFEDALDDEFDGEWTGSNHTEFAKKFMQETLKGKTVNQFKIDEDAKFNEWLIRHDKEMEELWAKRMKDQQDEFDKNGDTE